MVLSIKDPETDALARKIASITGETITEAIFKALQERYERISRQSPYTLADELDEIALRCAALPLKDRRSPEEIVGYDEYGLPM